MIDDAYFTANRHSRLVNQEKQSFSVYYIFPLRDYISPTSR